jgi:hypothetical protein
VGEGPVEVEAEGPDHRSAAKDGGSSSPKPAFYAARSGRGRDWWTLLHPPYTAWHLSYVVIGACLAARVNVVNLVATLLAFFLAVGLSAHALDELHGRPLRTTIPSAVLVAVAVGGLLGALALGIVGVVRVGWVLIPFMLVGPLLLVSYNAELFGGLVHNDIGFAAAWGSFPLLTAYVVQAQGIDVAAIAGAGAAFLLSLAQRSLSTPARGLRRRSAHVDGTITMRDGTTVRIDARTILSPLERALRTLSGAMVLLALSFALSRLT